MDIALDAQFLSLTAELVALIIPYGPMRPTFQTALDAIESFLS